MDIKIEIIFWRSQLEQGSILYAIESYRDRAIHFFGARLVAKKKMMHFRYMLDAYDIIVAPEDELLAKWNASKLKTISELGEISPSDAELLNEKFLYTSERIKFIKLNVRQYIESQTGRSDLSSVSPEWPLDKS